MKLSLYFIFYVVMILELLIFIMERDEATDRHNADVVEMLTLSDSLAKEFSKGLTISVPETTTAAIYAGSLRNALKRPGDSVHVVLVPLGLWSDAERHEVALTVFDSTGKIVAQDYPGMKRPDKNTDPRFRLSVNRATGDATFSTVFDAEGSHRFTAWCSVKRSVPGYYPVMVRDSVTVKLKQLLGAKMEVETRKAVPFTIVAKGQGQRLPPCEYCGQGPYRR
jgi:hypothetical protein